MRIVFAAIALAIALVAPRAEAHPRCEICGASFEMGVFHLTSVPDLKMSTSALPFNGKTLPMNGLAVGGPMLGFDLRFSKPDLSFFIPFLGVRAGWAGGSAIGTDSQGRTFDLKMLTYASLLLPGIGGVVKPSESVRFAASVRLALSGVTVDGRATTTDARFDVTATGALGVGTVGEMRLCFALGKGSRIDLCTFASPAIHTTGETRAALVFGASLDAF